MMLMLSQAGDPVKLQVRWNPDGFVVLQRGIAFPSTTVPPGAPPPPNPYELYAATTTNDADEEDREVWRANIDISVIINPLPVR